MNERVEPVLVKGHTCSDCTGVEQDIYLPSATNVGQVVYLGLVVRLTISNYRVIPGVACCQDPYSLESFIELRTKPIRRYHHDQPLAFTGSLYYLIEQALEYRLGRLERYKLDRAPLFWPVEVLKHLFLAFLPNDMAHELHCLLLEVAIKDNNLLGLL
jgi:hypothetical protein